MNVQADPKPKDFASDQEVRWCPGCGDYSILKGVHKVLAEVGARRENTVFVSGIGCSSRFPYYMSTYGFHTIHGRAPAVATGIKLANPALDVWVVTGDGDGLSIGGNHMIHALRRNVDLHILLFNNEIYGLTKGQVSPTSRLGVRTPSTPTGSIDNPISPCSMAMGVGGRFIARTADTLQSHLVEVLKRAYHFEGGAFVEILQNCMIFNDGVFSDITDKERADDHRVLAEHGKPLIFGREGQRKGLRFNTVSMRVEVVDLADGQYSESDLMVHDEHNVMAAQLLLALQPPEFPTVLGVIYSQPGETYDHRMHDQIGDEAWRASDDPEARANNLRKIFGAGPTWSVDE